MVIRILQPQPDGVKLGLVSRIAIALSFVIGLHKLINAAEGDRRKNHLFLTEEVFDIHLRRGAGEKADRCLAHGHDRRNAERLRHHEALTVHIADA